MSSVTQALSVCIILWFYLIHSLCNTLNMFNCFGMDVWHAQGSVIYFCRYETLLLDTRFFYSWTVMTIIVHLAKQRNKTFQLVSACWVYWKGHIFPWPCLVPFCLYEHHAASYNTYRCQEYKFSFHPTFCYLHCDFGI